MQKLKVCKEYIWIPALGVCACIRSVSLAESENKVSADELVYGKRARRKFMSNQVKNIWLSGQEEQHEECKQEKCNVWEWKQSCTENWNILWTRLKVFYMCVALKVKESGFSTDMFNVWFGGLQFLDGYEIHVLSLSLFFLFISFLSHLWNVRSTRKQ